MDKIFTFRIDWSSGNNFGYVRYTAHTKAEALSKFDAENELSGLDYEVVGVGVVYDSDDARKFGYEYGVPAEYLELEKSGKVG